MKLCLEHSVRKLTAQLIILFTLYKQQHNTLLIQSIQVSRTYSRSFTHSLHSFIVPDDAALTITFIQLPT